MGTVTVSTTPVTLDDGSHAAISIGNTGAPGSPAAVVTIGSRTERFEPGFSRRLLTGGVAVSAVTAFGTTTLAVDTTGVSPTPGQIDEDELADAIANLALGDSALLDIGTGAGTVAAGNDARIVGAAQKSANLSDLGSAATARTNLGLAAGATAAIGTAPGTVAAGDDSRIAGAAQKSANLSDLASAATARTNLGLAAGATAAIGTGAGTVAAGDDPRLIEATHVDSDAAVIAAGTRTALTTAIQALIDAASAANRAVQFGPKTYQVNSLQVRDKTILLGASPVAQKNIAGGITVLDSPAGQDTLVMAPDTTNPMGNIHIQGIRIQGGRRGISAIQPGSGSAQKPTFVNIWGCVVGGSEAGVYLEGPKSEWEFRSCQLQGGDYGLDAFFDDTWSGALDNMTFTDVKFAGAVNTMRVRSRNSTHWRLVRAYGTGGAAQHSVVLDGSLGGWTWDSCYWTENQAGSVNPNDTTGSITASSNSLVVASATGYIVGTVVTIAGAGSSAADLTATVTAVAGTTLTLDATASTTVTAADVTNARWDSINLAASSLGSPTGHAFINCQIGRGANSGIRYAIGGDGSSGGHLFLNHNTYSSPIYDRYGSNVYIGGSPNVRIPRSVAQGNADGASFIPKGPYVGLRPAAGSDVVFQLRDTVGDGTGSWGELALYTRQSNTATKRFAIDNAGSMRLRGRLGGPLSGSVPSFTDGDTTPSVLAGNVFKTANTSPTTITAFDDPQTGQCLYVMCRDANTTVAHNSNIKTNTASSKLLTSGQVYVFTADSGVWYEVSAPLVTGATPDIQVFASTGTWTKPSGAKVVEVTCVAAGAGGGSGRRGAAASVRGGGGGGGGAGRYSGQFRAADLTSTVSCNVGTGGAGGAAVTADDTSGNTGGAGNVSSFGSYLRATAPSSGGVGGTTSGGTAGPASSQLIENGTAGGAGGTGVAGSAGSNATAGGSGGGGGGGISAADAAFAGGAGGVVVAIENTGSAGGVVDSTLPTKRDHVAGYAGVGGGGGAASITTAAQAGSDGGTYGSGGGGGGAALNGNSSGAGGKGGDGVIVVVTYF